MQSLAQVQSTPSLQLPLLLLLPSDPCPPQPGHFIPAQYVAGSWLLLSLFGTVHADQLEDGLGNRPANG